jgi:hypothetical protein
MFEWWESMIIVVLIYGHPGDLWQGGKHCDSI